MDTSGEWIDLPDRSITRSEPSAGSRTTREDSTRSSVDGYVDTERGKSFFDGITSPETIAEVNRPRSRKLETAVACFLATVAFAVTAWIGVLILLPFFDNSQAWRYNVVLAVLAGFALCVSLYVMQIGWGAFQWTRKYRAVKDINWYEEWKEHPLRLQSQHPGYRGHEVYEWSDIQHFVIVTNYKEPIDMMRLLAYALMSQKTPGMCRKQITLVLGMEEREGEAAREKGETLKEELKPFFSEVFCTFHPADLPGEIKGKASNYKWAVKEVEEYIRSPRGQAHGIQEDKCLIHVADADSLYDPNYFPNVTYHFCIDPHRYEYMWQPCMLPSCNFWELAAPCRQVNTMIAAQEMMAAYAKIDVQIPFSTHGTALRTLQLIGNGSAADAQEGDVIAEDHHLFIKGFFALEGRFKIHPIYLPCLNFAVGGEHASCWSNMYDRYVQAKRHMFGVTELIYIIALLIRGRWCCRRTTHTKLGSLRTFGLFFKFLKIHGVPYLGLWVAMGLLLIIVLKVQKAICESREISHASKRTLCENNLSPAADVGSALIFTAMTTITSVGSVFIIYAFTKMLHATHFTLRNIADPHGSFMDASIWEAGSFDNTYSVSKSVSLVESRSQEDSVERGSSTGSSSSKRRLSLSKVRRPMVIGAGFPWVGTFLQLAIEFAILGFITSFVYGSVPAAWALCTFITKGHTLEYVTAPKPGSAANPSDGKGEGSVVEQTTEDGGSELVARSS